MNPVQKEQRRQHLLDSAYDLFLEKGMLATTISDIAERADVAKGTFYLYFHDKEDLFHALVEVISTRIVADAAVLAQRSGSADFTGRVIVFADTIIEYFRQHPAVLRLLDKHFSWPRFERRLASTSDPAVLAALDDLQHSPEMQGRTADEISHLIFVLTEMVGSTCYSSILESRPAPIGEMKPILYGIIRAVLDTPPAMLSQTVPG